jgi:hypothetical protein
MYLYLYLNRYVEKMVTGTWQETIDHTAVERQGLWKLGAVELITEFVLHIRARKMVGVPLGSLTTHSLGL